MKLPTLLDLRLSSLTQTQKETSVKLVVGGLRKVALGVARFPSWPLGLAS